MELLRTPTQDDIAKQLGVRREYVSRILNGLEPSDQLKKAIQMALEREWARRGEEREAIINGELEPALVGEDAPPPPTVPSTEDKRRQIRDQLDEIIRAAGDDLDELSWILIQLKRHITPMEASTAKPRFLEERPAVRKAREEAARIDWQREHGVSADPQGQKVIAPPAQKAGA
jgi:transcriptional regulator with XRE-family HTH domain